MQQRSNTPSQPSEDRNALVLALLEHVTPILRKSASAYHLDYEDLRQDASITIMQLIDSGEAERRYDLPRFTGIRVHSRIINLLQYQSRRRAASLDAQLASEDGDGCTLGDLVAAPDQWEPLANLTAQERIQELSSTLAQPMNGNRRRAIRERWETAAASCEVEV